jgi:hypothetical protein
MASGVRRKEPIDGVVAAGSGDHRGEIEGGAAGDRRPRGDRPASEASTVPRPPLGNHGGGASNSSGSSVGDLPDVLGDETEVDLAAHRRRDRSDPARFSRCSGPIATRPLVEITSRRGTDRPLEAR